MFCQRCGAMLKDGANFCTECGANLQTPELQKQYCKICGTKLEPQFLVCPMCGSNVNETIPQQSPTYQQPVYKQEPIYVQQPVYIQQPTVSNQAGIKCPRCKSTNINVQVMQENLGSETITKSKGKMKLSILVDTFCSRIRSKNAHAEQLALWN